MTAADGIDGILLVDKPSGWTSHDVVGFIRKRFKIKKAGHAGTLDPIATGLLVILLGKATKLSNTFLNDDKAYDAELTIGKRTDTADGEGEVLETNDIAGVGEDEVRGCLNGLRGESMQTPPMYSAKKVNGSTLYKLARRGIEVKREPKRILIKEIEVTKVALPKAAFSVTCSKGTYVRQLCSDAGDELGCGGFMSALRRTRSGPFLLKDAVTREDLDSYEGDCERIRASAAFFSMDKLREEGSSR